VAIRLDRVVDLCERVVRKQGDVPINQTLREILKCLEALGLWPGIIVLHLLAL
jgi:hypothetical protein